MLICGQIAPMLDAATTGGERIRWPDPQDHGQMLLAFTRPVESPHGRQALLDLARAAPGLTLLGARVAVVVPSSERAIRDWMARRGIALSVVADPALALMTVWDMGRDRWGLYTLRGLQQRKEPLLQAIRALRLGGGLRSLAVANLPAEILLAPDGAIEDASFACARTARPDLSAVARCIRRKGAGRRGVASLRLDPP